MGKHLREQTEKVHLGDVHRPAGVLEIAERLLREPPRKGNPSRVELAVAAQRGQLRVVGALVPVELVVPAEHVSRELQGRFTRDQVVLLELAARRRVLVLDATRDRQHVCPVRAAQLRQVAEVGGDGIAGVEQSEPLERRAREHRRLGGHQPSPAPLFPEVPAVVMDALERRPRDDRSSPVADLLPLLVETEIAVALTRGEGKAGRTDSPRQVGGPVGQTDTERLHDVAAAVVEPELAREQALPWVGFEEGQEELEVVRKPLIVGVLEGDVVARAFAQPPVPGPSHALVLLREDPDARVETLEELGGSGGRSVVDDDELPVLEGLRAHALDGAQDGIGTIEGGEDDRDAGHAGLSGWRRGQGMRAICSSASPKWKGRHRSSTASQDGWTMVSWPSKTHASPRRENPLRA